MADTVLVLVDIQNDYFPGGRNPLHKPEAAAAQARAVLELFRGNEWPLLHVQHISTKEGATFFLPDTYGAEIHESVRPREGEAVVVKHAPDSFLGTDLEKRLEALRAKRLVVCGMMSHMCIDTTVRSAKARGYGVMLVHDACATVDLEWQGRTIPADTVHETFMAALSGAFASVVAADTLQTELDR